MGFSARYLLSICEAGVGPNKSKVLFATMMATQAWFIVSDNTFAVLLPVF